MPDSRTDAPRPLVVLLRRPREQDPYELALEEAGLRSISLPILRYQAVHSAELAEALSHPERFGGLVLTSPRAIERVGECLGDHGTEWRSMPVFCVGPETLAEAAAHGLHPEGVEAGSGAELARHIIERYRDRRPLLFPCSTRRRHELPTLLTEADVPFVELAVYETKVEAGLELAEMERPAWVVLFSPSGVAGVADFLRERWNEVPRAAIGPTTAAALSAAGLPPAAEAGAPTPQALVEAIMNAGF